jgi:hypothetical protein
MPPLPTSRYWAAVQVPSSAANEEPAHKKRFVPEIKELSPRDGISVPGVRVFTYAALRCDPLCPLRSLGWRSTSACLCYPRSRRRGPRGVSPTKHPIPTERLSLSILQPYPRGVRQAESDERVRASFPAKGSKWVRSRCASRRNETCSRRRREQ